MRISFRQLIPLVLISVLTASDIGAQQPPSLSKTAGAVKAKVDKLSPQAHISVIPIQGEEEFGWFVSKDQEQFTFYDIDRKINVSLRYEEVRKIKSGYGGYNQFTGKHKDHNRAIVVGVVLATVLIVLSIAAARS